MLRSRHLLLILVFALCNVSLHAQTSGSGLLITPFENRVFIEEQGQFLDKLTDQGLSLTEPVLYALENAEFQAYFTRSGIHFRFAERKVIPKGERVRIENEPEERGIETTWHSVQLDFVGMNQNVSVSSEQKVHEYYNYSGLAGKPNINFVPAFKKLVYRQAYEGVDLVFELLDQGGLKYSFEVEAGRPVPEILLHWSGLESIELDEDGNLLLNSLMTLMKDLAPTSFTAVSGQQIPTRFGLSGNNVKLEVDANDEQIAEGIIIDPWIINTSFPAVNRAHDIQEDGAGNIIVHGNHTNYQVQKFSAGVLQWTYVTASVFLGDIAVDNPGNIYIIGGYSAGKRQKLNPAGVQQWTFSGLVEEWRLAFDYSKTVLTVGGYFLNPGGNNLARMDLNTGTISNQIIYGEETRAIATDCNGDMFSLHVTFGSTGAAASNTLRKTNADFTPGGSVPSGFLLAESESAAGYAPNPSYSPSLYHGFNGLVVSGLYVYMTDGATVRRVNKSSLVVLNSAPVPGGAKLRNSGMAADQCGNIYIGSQNGIVKYDSTLNFIQTIATPGAVYDLILGSTGELLACGAGYIGSFDITCTPPPPITALADNACDGTGSISLDVAGGLSPYTYVWQPGGQTTNPISGLSAGVYTYTVNDAFCRTFTGSVEIFENPDPTFTPSGVGTTNTNPNSVCLGESFQFTDNSNSNDGNIISWEWDFGDGATSAIQSPTHTYSSVGTYSVWLVVTTDNGCIDSLSTQVIVDPLPASNFSVVAACVGNANAFTDASTISAGSISSWSWDFGDGTTSAVQNPTHTYATSGTHALQLVTTSANGCSSSYTADAEVYDLPQADFTFPSTCVNDPTSFTSSSVEGDWPITAWQWTAEAQALSGATVQHIFSAEGTYPVQLTVTDQFGCSDQVTQSVTISVRPNISVMVNNECLGVPMAFSNSSSISSGTIASSDWDMGDGNSYSTNSPSHGYATPGVYSVTLELLSDVGCMADTTFSVQVYPNPVAALQWQNECEGTTIGFTELSSVASPGVLVPSDWNMGDGTILPAAVVTGHDYATYGNYTVQLDVETQHGCTDSETFVVSVHAVPTADFSFTNICEVDSVLFTDQSTLAQGNLVSWQWDFGNGQTHSGSSPSYQSYAVDGLYPVQLTVTSDSGCVNTFDDMIEVYPNPIANFSFDSVCFPLPIQFTDLSDPNGAYGITQWAWSFSDGQSSLQASPSVSFPQFGAYGATLLITNSVGCKHQLSLGDALVHPLPTADFNANFQHCYLETLAYLDQSSVPVLNNDAIIAWQYDLDDGSSSTSSNGSHQYASPGFYDLQLEVTTNHGCSDDIVRTVEVFPLPSVSFDADPKEGCDPLTVRFSDLSSITSPYSLSQWQWRFGDGTPSVSSQHPAHVYDPAGLGPNDQIDYDVTLVVTSTNGCIDSISFADLITVHPVPLALFSTDPTKRTTIVNPLFKFTDLSSINVSGWSWTFGDGLGSAVQHPEYTYADTGTYRVTLVVTTAFGCADTSSYTVIVEPHFSFYIPSAFTPNADGINETFFGSGEHFREYNMQIFDRWGELLFESNDPDFKWDGTYKGKPVEAGQYLYQFVIVDWQWEGHRYTGGVKLIR